MCHNHGTHRAVDLATDKTIYMRSQLHMQQLCCATQMPANESELDDPDDADHILMGRVGLIRKSNYLDANQIFNKSHVHQNNIANVGIWKMTKVW